MSDDGKYPSQTAERFQIRMPDGLRDRIRKAAKENGRAMNAEIVHRIDRYEELEQIERRYEFLARRSNSNVERERELQNDLRSANKLIDELQTMNAVIDHKTYDLLRLRVTSLRIIAQMSQKMMSRYEDNEMSELSGRLREMLEEDNEREKELAQHQGYFASRRVYSDDPYAEIENPETSEQSDSDSQF